MKNTNRTEPRGKF
ncbi:uncharacterized protein CELE_T06E8.8 [Caenorhabditis elegans]|uniref:Uncharacterized protein n=1 Tax=Caenorhabditis elegans TaxID=6239 RepID=A0A2K5ATX8_CAEEL|nr:Uncharacterized protein CELE_T06E8.8 [Caenorhabditis elegans]SPC47962.2 Uncharacterized protein CELE_T06E8.8 [Caenorhabditis elegans]|eukprot:NP_001348773.2 Uncharacterized protein CELE_T06E8.8 [Caenorhabditis elegans]